MRPARLDVLYEDNHLLVFNKPAGLATMGTVPARPTLVTLAKQYLKRKYHKPGNVYLGVVSRLDAIVTGAVVVARTSKAAERLSAQFREGRVIKTYWAVVERPLQPDSGTCVDWVRKNEKRHRMEVCRRQTEGAKQARLEYRTLQRHKGLTLLEIVLGTGRKHQIRLQLAARGAPIVGDRKYGGRGQGVGGGIALHARQLEFEHPVKRVPVRITAAAPPAWKRMGFWEKPPLDRPK